MVNAWPLPKDGVVAAIAILEDDDPTIPVYDEIPAPRPARFRVVSGMGGDYSNPAFSEPRVLVENWASDSATAAGMALAGMRAFKNSGGKTFSGTYIHGCGELQGPTDYNDPDIQDRRRCQFFGPLRVSTD
jgi:hypothetical protein